VLADREFLDWTITGNPYQQPVGTKVEAAHIRNRRSWINEFEHLKLLDDLECSYLVLPATDGRSAPLIDFRDI
jgi:hypothetical protein